MECSIQRRAELVWHYDRPEHECDRGEYASSQSKTVTKVLVDHVAVNELPFIHFMLLSLISPRAISLSVL
jgi:hypothetical protein